MYFLEVLSKYFKVVLINKRFKMKEKISWLFVMLFVMSLVACSGSSSTSTSDECTEDPNAPGCSVDDNTPAEME